TAMLLMIAAGAAALAQDKPADTAPQPDSRRANVALVGEWRARMGTPISSNDILSVTDLGCISLSRDNRRVAYVSRKADAACNCFRHAVHVVDLSSRRESAVADLGQPFLATQPNGRINGALMSATPKWSPNSRRLAYIREKSGHHVLGLYDTATRSN